MVSLAKWMVTVFFSPIPCWVITMEFAAGSMLLTNPPTPCLRHSSRSWVCFSAMRSEEHTSELQSQSNLVCRLLLEKKNTCKRHSLVSDEEDRDAYLHRR